MLPFPSLPWFELARFRRSRLSRAAIVAVAIVPLFYGVLYVWANWNPIGNLDHVSAAVVNSDQPVTVTGSDGKKQTVPLGRVLAGNLTGSSAANNFDWVLTDTADARSGLDDGKYAAVVTIPRNFSAAATSTSGSDGSKAQQAKLDIQTNDAQNYLTGTIATAVGNAATAALNAQVSGSYLNNVYLGFNSLHSKIGDAADGASRLSTGAGSLSSGAASADQGAGELVVGLNQLNAGTRALPQQVGQLNSGAFQVSSGAGSLVSGAYQLDGGLKRLAFGTSNLPSQTKQLDSGARGLASGASTLSEGASRLADGAGNVSTGAGFVTDGLTAYRTQARALATACSVSGASAAYCAQVTALTGGLDPLVTGASGVSQGATLVKGGASSLATGASALSSGASQLRTGTRALAKAAPTLTNGIKKASTGAAALDQGAFKLAAGASQLADGTARLAAATPRLSAGVASAAGGASALHDGTGRLASGAKQLDTGSAKLASGLSDGASAIPQYDSAARTQLSKVAATPVVADTSRLNAVQNNGVGLAPYFVALALWVGAMATFMLLRALSARTLASTASSWRAALAGYLPGAVLVTIQAVLLVAVLHFVVGLDAARLPALTLFAVVIALTYAAINQALIATFGGAGRFLALIFVSLQLSSAGGTYPIDTAPAFFSFLHTYLPMSYAVHGLRACLAGGASGVGSDVLVLLIWAVGAGLVTVLAASRQRTWTLSRLHATAIV